MESNPPPAGPPASQVDRLCDMFAEACRSGSSPQIEVFLTENPVAPADRHEILRRLLLIEIPHRLDLGERPALTDYLARFPDLATNLALVRDIEHSLHRPSRSATDAATLLEDAARHETPYTGFESTGIGEPADRASPATHITGTQTDAGSTLGTNFGRYRIVRLLGEGGMGRVFLAHDQQLDRQVALKIPRLELANEIALERFMREARAAALLRHPHICPIYDVGEVNGVSFLTMAFIEGETLSRHAKPDQLLPQRQVAMLLQKLARAVHEAHQQGVVHRDLKPDNIMIDRRGEPIIMDFGLARREQPGEQTLTHLGAVLGTPAYMSPEQITGDNKAVGPHSDLYSLGVILYELLVGQRPFQGPSAIAMAKILRDAAPSPSSLRPDVEPKLEWVCWKAMSKRPSDRYRSGEEMAQVLEEFLAGTAAKSSSLLIRPQAVVIDAPTEPIETYQLTPNVKPEPEAKPAKSSLQHIATIQNRIRELVDETDLSKSLLNFANLETNQRSAQKLSQLVAQGRDEIQRLIAAKQHGKALRVAAAMHLAGNAAATMAELVLCATEVATARWNPKEPSVSIGVWQKMLTAFPDEAALRKQAVQFADQHATAFLQLHKPMPALALLRQCRQWADTSVVRRKLVDLLKQVATAAVRAKKFDLARTLCDEALQIYPKDEPLQQLRQQASPQ